MSNEQERLTGNAAAEWAKETAEHLIAEYSESAAMEMCGYSECGFVMAAAGIAKIDPEFARRIGELMEPPRSVDRAWASRGMP